jgi:iron complex transport system permease protein
MNHIVKRYKDSIKKKIVFITILIFLIFIFTILSVSLGSADISFGEIIKVFLGMGNESFSQIIFNIRLPRVIAALIGGCALAISGVVMQNVLRNPLASPFTLGISHAAAFGASFAVIVLGAGTLHSSSSDLVMVNSPSIVTICAFVFSLVCILAIILMAKFRDAKPETMILTGIVLGSLFTAGTTTLQYFADDVQLASVVFWTFGDLGKAVWRDFFILSALIIPSLIYFLKNSWNYNVLQSGDESAKSLGINVDKLRIISMLVAALATSVVVSFFGIIAFVGLVVPHIVRNLMKGNDAFLFSATALFGALFLLIADTVARTIFSPIILPVGILTSFIGAPLFLFLLLRKNRRGYW